MWFPSLLLLLAFTTVIADMEEDIERCVSVTNFQEMESLESLKTNEDLKVFCPMMLGAFDCVEDVLKKETAMDFELLALLTEGTEFGKGVEVVLNIRGIFKDLCEEGSSLNEAYLADADCFGETLDRHMGFCNSKFAMEGSEASEDFAENAIEEAGEDAIVEAGEDSPDEDCMKAAYKTACVAALVHDKCGRRAFNTYNTVVKRSGIFKNMLCSAEELQHLKEKFVDDLDVDDEKKDLFRLALDLKKRRK